MEKSILKLTDLQISAPMNTKIQKVYKPISERTLMVKITYIEILTDLHISATLNTKRGGFGMPFICLPVCMYMPFISA
jgi:hypothetical protein